VKNVIVEVGANYGNDTARFVQDKNNEVWAFEPTPELVDHLKNKFKDDENFYLIDKAVDVEEGKRIFNIAGGGDWGCSSLYEFTEDIHEKWQGRPDFNITHTVEVDTIRLDTFIINNNIEKIDYLWIDAQGNDFKVLKSLGEKLDIVKEGKCEGSYTVDLYKTEDNRVIDIMKWLEDKNFECNIVPDNVNKEADVHFRKKQ
jgi:FkbM family methyltransferase